jgi:hypothetical protein
VTLAFDDETALRRLLVDCLFKARQRRSQQPA